ncbi:bifunctional MaoC family dehydratase N-terminal/OB-fold nucleic acid binding domain-containing protein [Novosphingobium sp. ES2-1]|uniref:bifunctional MaoC family dehydratase N-terminal/OB-fold nucleic acid binding domain-containing protein n=1 Tax=Novosphingobium sp. ES2-1 TaxID=2780074 RepID=UPI00188127B9|nr:MaoC family dehydratase N-terminal domain-containing protein [Novosphingobium sp. ES2-1]QOV96401.1 MaoC family dehydratase N-terminal domain-containing protein [Novosphingobium sp. ES2-1]
MTVQQEALARARAFVAAGPSPVVTARDPVNQPMIRRWCEAMGDANPLYQHREAAQQAGLDDVVSPPAMLDVWTMEPYNPLVERVGDHPVFAVLEEYGFTRIVATNVEQEYDRYLAPGDLVSMTVRVADVSDEKRTGLGDGHFVTLWYEFTDQHGAPVGRMSFRLLKFKPRVAGAGQPREEKPEQPPAEPPRPITTPDTKHFWKGLIDRQVLIQQCSDCNELRHPPTPMCPHCRSMKWHTLPAVGRGVIHSFALIHQPKLPGFEYPLPVVLVDLEEGVRLLANLVVADNAEVAVGRKVVLDFREITPDFVLPVFRLDDGGQ